MKKTFLIGIIASTMFLTGCSTTKILTCSKTNESENFKQETIEKITYDSKSENVVKVTANITETSNEETANANKLVYDTLFGRYNNVSGINASTNLINDNSLEYFISIDFKTLDKEAYNYLLESTPNKTILMDNLDTEINIENFKNNYLSDYKCE